MDTDVGGVRESNRNCHGGGRTSKDRRKESGEVLEYVRASFLAAQVKITPG
jgi:hypothetical protein